MRIDPQNSLMFQIQTGIYNLALVMILFITLSCNRYNLEDFNPDRISPISTEKLKELSDTAFVKKQLATLSAGQQIDSLIYYSEWLKKFDDEIAIHYAMTAYDIATEKNWNYPRAISAFRIASLRGYKAQFGEDIEFAIVDAKIAERLFKDFDRPDWELRVNSLLGQLEMRKGEYQVAQDRLKESLEQLKTIDNWDSSQIQEQKAFLLHDLAFTYADTLTIYQYFKESDSLYQITNNQEDRARLWLDWANYHAYYENFQEANSLLDRCINYAEKQDKEILKLAFRGKGNLLSLKYDLYGQLTDFNKALIFLNQCQELSQFGDYRAFDIAGKLYQDSWINENIDVHADSAIINYKIAISKASEAGAIDRLKKLSKNLASICDYKDGKHKAALGEPVYNFLNKNYTGVTDTITNHSKLAFKRINKVEQRDIQVQATRKRQSQLYFALAILGLTGLIFLLIVQAQKNRRIQAEMDALRAQINPHFISNSLNAIESLVNFGDTKAAAKYLVHFSRLSRQILNGSRASMVSLAEELKTLKHFLALEQLRFRDKLTFDIEVIDDIPAEIVHVPAMILQPYAENAIWHGIKPKAEGGHVQISVRKIDKMLVCIVEDNGIGREQSRAMRKASVLKHKSMGMQITEERLKNLGKIKGSHVEIVDLKTENGEAKGTKVIIRFPYQTKKV